MNDTMHAVVLTDTQYEKLPQRLRKQLEAAPAGLPDGRELFDYVRASVPRKGNTPPPAFVEVTDRVTALEQELAAARAELHDLVREAYDRGVAASTLGRWANYTPRWIGTILGVKGAGAA